MSFVKTSPPSIKLVIFILYIVTNPNTTCPQQSLLQKICDKTTDPSECMSYVAANPHLVGVTTLHEIAHCVTHSINKIARKCLVELRVLISQSPSGAHRSIQPLETCMKQYEIIREKMKLVNGDGVDIKKNGMSEMRMVAMSTEHAVNLCLASIGLTYPSVTMFNVAVSRLAEMLLIISSEKHP